MEDPMVVAEFAYWNSEVESEWDNYLQRFALKPKGARVHALKMVDSWLSDGRPTKEYASMWQRKRELENLHWRLDRLGK